MVNEFLINQPESVKRDLAYNYYQKDEDDEENVEAFLKERMRSKIQAGYAYKEPEVEVEKEDVKTDTPYLEAQKDMLNEILSFNKMGENMYRFGEKPAISFYKSDLFKDMLPDNLKYVKEGDTVQIQDVRNTNINHTIEPEMSLEYNIRKLIPLLRSKQQ